MVNRNIGDLLVDNGQINAEELEQALAESGKTGESLIKALEKLGFADENQIKNVLELEYGINYVPLKKLTPNPEVASLLPIELIREHRAVPIRIEGRRLVLAMVSPDTTGTLDELKKHLPNWQIKPVVCLEDDFLSFVDQVLIPQNETKDQAPYTDTNSTVEEQVNTNNALTIDAPPQKIPDSAGELEDQLANEHEDMAIVLLSNHILANAISKGCTNIHIEPNERQILVHYRKDGVLFAARKLPLAIKSELVRRYKTMAAGQTQEKSLPFDGRLNVQMSGQSFSFRLSIIPGAYGEHLIIWLD